MARRERSALTTVFVDEMEVWGMNWHEIEQKLPTMNQEQLVDSLKICLRLIERMERELGDGARKMDEMTALLHKLSEGKSVNEGT
jgi:hypothetical protein